MARVMSVVKQRNPSWDDKNVKANFSGSIMKYVPRVVPRTEILLQRFDNVIGTFKVVRDGATGNCNFVLEGVNPFSMCQVGKGSSVCLI